MPYILINIYLLYRSITKPNKISAGAVLVVTFLITTTYYNGSDWRTYEIIYDNQEQFETYFLLEPGLGYIFNFFSSIDANFHIALISLKVLVLSLVTWFIFTYSNRRMIAYCLFILTCGYGLFIDNPLRQMLALPFFLAALIFSENKNPIKFLLAIVCGAIFHLSILIFTPLYLIARFNKRLLSILMYTLPVLFVLIFISAHKISPFLESLPVIGFYARHYINEDMSIRVSTSAIFALALFYTLLFIQNNEKPEIHSGDSFRVCAFLFLISYILGSVSDEVLRFSYYLAIPYSIYLSNRDDKIGKSLVLIVVCIHLIQITQMLYSSYKFLPYTNYVWSAVNNEYKSYEFRSNFHFNANPNSIESENK